MSDQQWRKSSRSSTNANCVELRVTSDEAGVRDTKSRTAGELRFSRATFSAFLAGLKSE